MSYATDRPEDDHELSRCWAAWLVAREVGDAEWVRFAINELRIAATRAQDGMGVLQETGSGPVPFL